MKENTVDDKRKTRIAMLTIFVVVLIAPLLSWTVVRNFVNTENQENRTFAEFPEISLENAWNITSGLEDWFNDRVPYKNQVMSLTSRLKLAFNSQDSWMSYYSGSRVIVGKDDWLYYNGGEGESTIADYMGGNLYTDEELEELAAGYQKLADQYKAVGTRLILFIPPNKEQIYPELMPDSLGTITDYSRMDQFVSYMKEHVDFPVIYAKEALLEEKANGHKLYYTYDSHWNLLGAFIGTQLIREAISGEYDTLEEHWIGQLTDAEGEPVPEDRDLARMLGLSEDTYTIEENLAVLDYHTDVYSHPGYWVGDRNVEFYNWVSTSENPQAVLLLHDSFAFNMEELMSRDFASMLCVQDVESAREYVKATPPDIAIIEIVERKQETLETTWKEMLLDEE